MGWISDLLKEIPSAARYKSELEAIEKENAALKAKVGVLEAEAVNLRQEIQRRDDVIQKEKSHGDRLEEKKEIMLALVAQTERLSSADIAEQIGASKQLATLHLHDLRDEKLVRSNFGLDADSYEVEIWFIEQRGRKYLSHHGLL